MVLEHIEEFDLFIDLFINLFWKNSTPFPFRFANVITI